MRHTRFLAALLTLSLLLLTACSKTTPQRRDPPTSQVRPGGDITTVVIGLLPWDDTPAMNELIRVFQEEHPAIRIQKRMMRDPNDADSLLRNKQVDLISDAYVRSLTGARLLQPLDPYIDRSKLDWQAIGVMDELQTDGRIYDLPYSLSPFVLLYNEAICQSAGIGTPTKSWTWDDLRLAARQAAKGSGTDRVWGYAPIGMPWWEFALYALGESPDRRWWANGPAVKHGLEYFGGLIQTDGSAPFVPNTDPPTLLTVSPASNNAALAIRAVGNLGDLSRAEQQSGLKLGFAPTPLTPGAPPVMGAQPHTIAMAAGSSVPEAAWSFLTFIAGPRGAETVARLGYMPAYRTPELMQLWLQNRTARMDGLDDMMNRSVRLIREQDPTMTPAQRLFMYELIQQLFSGQRNPEEAFGRYQDALPRSTK